MFVFEGCVSMCALERETDRETDMRSDSDKTKKEKNRSHLIFKETKDIGIEHMQHSTY